MDRQLYPLCIPKIQLGPVTALPRHEVVKICTAVCLRLREKSSLHLAAEIGYERMSESLDAQFQKTVLLFVHELVLFRLPVELYFIHATTQRIESSCEVSRSFSWVSPVLRREPNLDAFPYPLDLPLLHF
ncbi:unnamed protein product [Ixodes pacificus]